MAVLTNGNYYHILLKQVKILGPPLYSHVSLFSWCQTGILLITCHCAYYLGGGVKAFVEHGGKNVNCWSVLLAQEDMRHVGQVEVYDDVINECIMFKCLII